MATRGPALSDTVIRLSRQEVSMLLGRAPRSVTNRSVNETTIQIDIVNYLRLVLPDAIVFHVPNGGLRSKAEAGRLKRMGVVPGIPDLIIWLPGGRTIAMEVKVEGGYTSREQRAMHDWMRGNGLAVGVVRSIDDARERIETWGIETQEASR